MFAPTTTLEAGYVLPGDVVTFGGATVTITAAEAGPEHGEVSLFLGAGDRYIVATTDPVIIRGDVRHRDR